MKVGSSLLLALMGHVNMGGTCDGYGAFMIRRLGTMSCTGVNSMKRSPTGSEDCRWFLRPVDEAPMMWIAVFCLIQTAAAIRGAFGPEHNSSVRRVACRMIQRIACHRSLRKNLERSERQMSQEKTLPPL